MSKQVSSVSKEKELVAPEEEKFLEEAQPILELEPGVKSYIEQVEEEPQVPDDLQGHLYSHHQSAKKVLQDGPTIVLPLTEEQIEKGLHQTVFDAILWLATWCVKIATEAKHLGYRVIFGKK